LTNNRFEMESDKHCESSQCIKSISNTHLNDEWNQIPNVVWNEKQVVLYCIYHNYTHNFLNLNDKFYFFFQIILNVINLWIQNPTVQTQKVKPKIKCTTFWKVYTIIFNTKRPKMQVTTLVFMVNSSSFHFPFLLSFLFFHP